MIRYKKWQQILKVALLIIPGILVMAVKSYNDSLASAAQEKKWYVSKEIDFSGEVLTTRGAGENAKLEPRLRLLLSQFEMKSRGGDENNINIYSDEQLKNEFKIDPAESNPQINVILSTVEGYKIDHIKKGGVKFYSKFGNLILASIPVRSLAGVAGEAGISSIEIANNNQIPLPPDDMQIPQQQLPERGGMQTTGQINSRINRRKSINLPLGQFRSSGLTGKGVIVGIVDSGIDWTHEDFIKPDGTTKIIAIWDQNDNSYVNSGGRIGLPAPTFDDFDRSSGTVYTAEHINAALSSGSKLPTMDYVGHGTACAGTAAGRGKSGQPGVLPYTQGGVAPDADLLIVKSGDCEGVSNKYLLGVSWIGSYARSLKRPASISLSFGNHLSSHQGDNLEDQLLSNMSLMSKNGIIISAAAGNEGDLSFHASGKFGPKPAGQGDNSSQPLEFVISEKRSNKMSVLSVYFNAKDEWAFQVAGIDKFLVDGAGNPIKLVIFKRNGKVDLLIPKNTYLPRYMMDYLGIIYKNSIKLSDSPDGRDQLLLPLNPGTYQAIATGVSEKVMNGGFSMYLPSNGEGAFTIGARKSHMVSSPGTSAGVITVGAYDFRSEWIGVNNIPTAYAINVGGISNYSSPGGQNDLGIYKPDIAAPATYTISTLSSGVLQESSTNCIGAKMVSSDKDPNITSDGRHIAWKGTSAATPYVAGVIALMLQKNPNLNTEQVRQILVKSSDKGGNVVGATPNPYWGHGRINPEAAIKATPLPRPVTKMPLRKKTK